MPAPTQRPRPRPRPTASAPRLTAVTYGPLNVVATADYPPGTPAAPTPSQHAAAFADVLAAVFARTSDLADITFYFQPACGPAAWRAAEASGWPMAEMLDRVAGRAG